MQLWDTASGALVRTLYEGDGKRVQGSSDPAYAADLSSDGRLLATGHGSGIIRLWDIATGAELAAANRHEVLVTALELAPDGKHLVSADKNGLLLAWPL